MKRFCGMMPSDEIEISRTATVGSGSILYIDAGPHGWTVRTPDGGSIYSDVDRTAEENLDKAIEAAKAYYNITKIEPVA